MSDFLIPFLTIDKPLIPVLAVALITWGGVLIYLLRISTLLKSVQRDVHALDEIDNQKP